MSQGSKKCDQVRDFDMTRSHSCEIVTHSGPSNDTCVRYRFKVLFKSAPKFIFQTYFLII